MTISVVIPVYKKTEMFLENLRHNLPHLQDSELIVVNDDPSLSIRSVMQEFAHVRLIENTHNLGFAGAAHAGIMASTGSLVMLLNSDVLLLDDSFKTCGRYFTQDRTLFAVSFLQIANQKKSGKNKLMWDRGFLIHDYASNLNSGITGWAEGGTCILDKSKYVPLGGFNPIYAPFYWEDVDLSFRAWKAGYRVRFESTIEVLHEHESTIGTYFKDTFVKKIAYRNQLLCIWLNISSPSLRLRHTLFLIKRLITSIGRDTVFIQAYFEAVKRFYTAGSIASQPMIRSDEDIINQFLHE